MRAGASTFDRENRLRFGERDVARCYAFRPPYAAALYQYVLGVVDGRDRLLDIGCGPGKIAHVLAPHFASVVAVDPSGPMLEAAREHATTPNIRWVLGDAESADFSGPFDLITIGAAVHWLRHEIIFPRMADWLGPTGRLAIIDGDGQHEPLWQDAWLRFLEGWLRKVGSEYDDKAFAAAGSSYSSWMDIERRMSFVAPFRQKVEDFIECQHSRATWARANMGADLAGQFDKELHDALCPFAENGWLAFDVRSNLVLGHPRTSRKDDA